MKHTVRILCIVLMAILVCVGLAACEHKEAADHTATGEWLSDETHHWHACEKEKCADAGDRAEHVYDNACDAECNTCAYKRTAGAHVYDNACDASCNVCGATRTPAEHAYDNACDTACNVCGATRTITHAHGTTLTAGDATHYYACSVCGDKKDEAAHIFDKTVAHSDYLKAAATATTKAQYWKSCVCGKASATEYFETDKAPANLQVADISKTYDGTPVLEPDITFDGVGGEGFEYWQGTTKLSGKPTNAGTYKVIVTIGETETHAGDRVEREFTIAKKVLSNMKASIAYDGSTTFGEVTLAHDGIVSGDVIIADIDITNKKVGVYTGTNAVFAILDVLGHGAANYEIDAQTTEVTVTPKVLSNLTFSVVYNGDTYHGGVAIPSGVVAGDEFLVDIELYNKNVGTYTCKTPEKDETVCWEDITPDGADYENYEVDRATATVTVTPKTINVTAEFEYVGSAVAGRQLQAPDASLGDVIAGDELFIQILFESGNAGALVKTGEDAPYLDGADCDNYTLGTYSFSIKPKTLLAERLIDYTISKTYDGTNVFTQSLNTTHGILDGDTVSVSFAVTEWDGTKDVALIDSDTYESGLYTASDVTLRGESAGNYVLNTDGADISQGYTIEILSKAITLGNEGISFTLVTGQKVYECTLTPAHGIVANETVIMRVEFTNAAAGAPVKPAGVKFLVGETEVVNYHLTSTDNIKLVNA